MIKSNNIQSTWVSIKSKIQCSILMFSIIALASGLIGLIFYYTVGHTFIANTGMYKQTIVPINISNTFSPMLISTIIGMFVFALFYSVRNTQSQTFSLGINRSAHYLSNLTSTIFYSVMFSLVALIFELIIRSSTVNSNIFLAANYKILSVNAIFSSLLITICFTLLTFSVTSAIVNTIMNKRYGSLLILIAIGILLSIVIIITFFLIADYTSIEAYTKFYNFIFSCAGVGLITLFITLAIEGYNYWLIRRGGLKR